MASNTKICDGDLIINKVLETGEIPSDIDGLNGDRVRIKGTTIMKMFDAINKMTKDYTASQSHIGILKDRIRKLEMNHEVCSTYSSLI